MARYSRSQIVMAEHDTASVGVGELVVAGGVLPADPQRSQWPVSSARCGITALVLRRPRPDAPIRLPVAAPGGSLLLMTSQATTLFRLKFRAAQSAQLPSVHTLTEDLLARVRLARATARLTTYTETKRTT